MAIKPLSVKAYADFTQAFTHPMLYRIILHMLANVPLLPGPTDP